MIIKARTVLLMIIIGLAVGAASSAVSSALTEPPRPASTPAVTKDSPGWDCLRQGNLTCRVDGVLVTSLEGMPSDPYGRCDFLLGISERVGGIGYADELCSPIAGQRG